jgi:hypothetical protein
MRLRDFFGPAEQFGVLRVLEAIGEQLMDSGSVGFAVRHDDQPGIGAAGGNLISFNSNINPLHFET